MIEIISKDKKYKTGIELFPIIKIKYLDDVRYILVIESSSEKYCSFIITKNMVFKGFEFFYFHSNLEYILPEIDCFSDDPLPRILNLSTEKVIIEKYKESYKEYEPFLFERYIFLKKHPEKILENECLFNTWLKFNDQRWKEQEEERNKLDLEVSNYKIRK